MGDIPLVDGLDCFQVGVDNDFDSELVGLATLVCHVLVIGEVEVLLGKLSNRQTARHFVETVDNLLADVNLDVDAGHEAEVDIGVDIPSLAAVVIFNTDTSMRRRSVGDSAEARRAV